MIFGAGGFVGKSMLKYLEQETKYQVVTVFHQWIKDRQDNVFCIDITDQASVDKIIASERPNQIVNLAGIHFREKSNQFPQTIFDVNVKGTINILESIRRHQVDCKVLVVGSSEEYAPSDDALAEFNELKPRNIYGMTKLWQEMVAEWYHREYGIKVICVRAFNHTGIYQSDKAVVASFCKQVARIEVEKSDSVLYVGNLNIERDISDVRDVIRAYVMLLNSDIEFGIYNVCSGKKIKLCDMMKIICSFSSKDIKVIPDLQRIRINDIPIIYGDYSKIKEDIGWSPKVELCTTLREIYDYHYQIARINQK